ncbi:MAG: hypothetical protein GTO14_07195 [Anaerolineales bacterium]|nr:hypothetical protein [Anaerolineales bacterium]
MDVQSFRILGDITMDLYDLMEVLGIILRAAGAMAFGLGVGWLAVQSVRMKVWQYAVATMLGLLAAFVLIGRWVASPGTLGGFGLGVGVALVIWGVGRIPEDGGKK